MYFFLEEHVQYSFFSVGRNWVTINGAIVEVTGCFSSSQGFSNKLGGKGKKLRVEFFSTLFPGSKDRTMATFNSNPHLQGRPNDKVPLFLSFILCLQNNKSVYGVLVPTWCHHVLRHDISGESVCQSHRESALFICPDTYCLYSSTRVATGSRCFTAGVGSVRHPVFQGSNIFYCRPCVTQSSSFLHSFEDWWWGLCYIS